MSIWTRYVRWADYTRRNLLNSFFIYAHMLIAAAAGAVGGAALALIEGWSPSANAGRGFALGVVVGTCAGFAALLVAVVLAWRTRHQR